tara:strand:+ start:1292 stop:2323 length:1032 start_codon:yes stop_codon:yes gene_type:complete
MAYTTINDPSAHFQSTLFTGNGSSGHAITNTGSSNLQPDWLWIKNASAVENHLSFDSTRGATQRLYPDLNYDEDNNNSSNFLQSFNTDGFTVGSDAMSNGNGNSVMGWQWKANGGTTATDTNGAVNSTVQANTTAGFSIVTWTSAGSTNVGHGLGVAPNLIIIKARNATENWLVGSDEIDWSKRIKLNSTDGSANSSAFGQAPTSSIFYCNPASSSYNYVAYCFAEKQGYSKFGSYTGNGNADGPFVYTGFQPAWLLIKRTDSAKGWYLYDNKRNTFNTHDKVLVPNSSGAEITTDNYVDFLSNGFKLRGTSSVTNANNGNYIYLSFAFNPFVSSAGVPTTAR